LQPVAAEFPERPYASNFDLWRLGDRLLLASQGRVLSGLGTNSATVSDLVWMTIPLPKELADLPEGPLQ
jgi:hypothetical protein